MTNPVSSQLTKGYPSDPAKRYRQPRVGGPVNGVRTNQVWTCTIQGTGGLAFLAALDAQRRPLKNNQQSSDLTLSPVATTAAMLTFFENLVGVGNVTVTGGPGDATGTTPYIITFVGELAGTRVHVIGGADFISGGNPSSALTLVDTTPGGRSNPGVPVGPAFATNTTTSRPANSPRTREGDPE